MPNKWNACKELSVETEIIKSMKLDSGDDEKYISLDCETLGEEQTGAQSTSNIFF
jgi:hypothetical protein